MAKLGSVPGDRAGTTVGPYAFLGRIGVGGMGEVWKGEDRRLNRDVALKVIRPDLLQEARVRERFVREARHASSVVHPYVATVFDVVEDRGDTVLVMEYVQGRGLQDIIFDKDGPPRDERLRYGLEIAEALEAIHGRGILHRDLKPGNVMITSSGHVKVLDFGLAHRPRPIPGVASPELADTTGTSLTAPGTAAGTIAYMSPEQIRDEPLDVRSDLFALGVILCELATSHHPFLRESIPKTVSAILEDDPFKPESGTDTVTPRALQPVIARALAKSRDRRYTSAAEIASDLQDVLRGETARSARVAVTRRRTRIAWAAVAASALVAAAAIGGAIWWRKPPNWSGPRVSVAFVALDDKTGLADGPVRAAMVADLLATDLASSRIVRPIGPDETRPILAGIGLDTPGPVVAQRLAGALNVDYVARGALYREGDRFVATLETIPTRGGPPLGSLRASGTTATAVAESLARAMRSALPGVSTITAARDDRGADLVALTSESEDARVLFERANLAWRDGRIGDAISFLDKAIAIDPKFALARATLARVRHEAGYGRMAREEADRARAYAPTGDSPAAERLRLTLDVVRAEVSEDASSFVTAAGQLAARYGDEPETLQLHAEALSDAGRGTEALAAVDRAIALDKSRPALHLTRAEILASAERWDDALKAIDEAGATYELLGSAEGKANAARWRGKVLLQAQRHEAATASLSGAIEQFRTLGRENLAADSSRDLAGVYLMTGRPNLAATLLDAAARQARAAGNLGLVCRIVALEGAQAYLQADYANAEALLRDAVDQARRLQNDNLLMDPLSNLTSLLSYVGRYGDARALIEELLATVTRVNQPDRVLDARLNLANLDLMQGRFDESIKIYDDVLRADGETTANQNVAWARLARSEVFQTRGRLADALADAEAAVAVFDKLGATGFAGYARLRRGLVRAELGRSADATADFVAAEREARRDESGLADLAARLEIARVLLAASEGRAARRPTQATETAVAGSPVLRAWFHAAQCEEAVARNDAKRAEATCKNASGDAAAQAGDAVAARAARAEALAVLRRSADAREEASKAFEEAERLGLPLSAARAAAVLCNLPETSRPADLDDTRKRGRAFFEAYLSGMPASDLERVKRRAGIARLEKALGSKSNEAATSQIQPPRERGGVGAPS